MFHIPAHKNVAAPAAQYRATIECDCGWGYGCPECDETGAPYTCYRCCNSGVAVLVLGITDEEANEDAAHARREAALLVLLREQEGPEAVLSDYYIDTDWCVFMPRRRTAPIFSSIGDDDFPF
jgi:hypothetical protein